MRALAKAMLAVGLSTICVAVSTAQSSSAPRSTHPHASLPHSPSAAEQRLRDEIRAIEALLPHFADRGAALYLLAHHYARLGEPARAMALLKECVELDEGFNPSRAKTFDSLKNNPEFQKLQKRVQSLYPPVHKAQVAFTLRQSELFPEGLTVDVSRRVFYMGSMYRKKIVRITEAGELSDFVKEGIYDLMPVGGVHVDPVDHSIWCATDPGEKNRSEIVHFGQNGKLLERYTAPGTGSHDLNDLLLRGNTEIFVTDTEGNKVYRFDRRSHTFKVLNLGRPVFYPNGITLSDDGSVLYVADGLGIIRLDLRSNNTRDVKPAPHDTLAGIDGLYWYKGSLVGVQYGTGAFRVMQWKLSPDGVEVTSSVVLERGTDLVRDPTTGAILNGSFFFMSNTGIDNLRDGKIVDPARLEPLQIAVVPLN